MTDYKIAKQIHFTLSISIEYQRTWNFYIVRFWIELGWWTWLIFILRPSIVPELQHRHAQHQNFSNALKRSKFFSANEIISWARHHLAKCSTIVNRLSRKWECLKARDLVCVFKFVFALVFVFAFVFVQLTVGEQCVQLSRNAWEAQIKSIQHVHYLNYSTDMQSPYHYFEDIFFFFYWCLPQRWWFVQQWFQQRWWWVSQSPQQLRLRWLSRGRCTATRCSTPSSNNFYFLTFSLLCMIRPSCVTTIHNSQRLALLIFFRFTFTFNMLKKRGDPC